MFVSIIIANFNYQEYVAAAIESALSQHYRPVEVIVVDDGSTDRSRDVIMEYAPRIQCVFQENAGQGSAFNSGWLRARGDVVMFLDSDDVLLPDAAGICVDMVHKTSCHKVQFLLQRVDQELNSLGSVVPVYPLGDQESIQRDIQLWGYYPATQTSGNAFSRQFLNEVMPVPNFRLSGGGYDVAPDAYLSGMAGIMGKVVSVPQVLGLYRVHGRNISESSRVETVEKLRWLFMQDYIREKHQQKYMRDRGMSVRPDLSRFHPAHCKMRFVSYRISPDAHPVKEDRFWTLLTCGIRGAVRFPYSTTRKRLFSILGFAAIAVLPRAALKKIISAVTEPEERRGILAIAAWALRSANSRQAMLP